MSNDEEKQGFKLNLGNVGKYSRKQDVLKILANSGFDQKWLRNVKKGSKQEMALLSFEDEATKEKARVKLLTLKNHKNGEPFIVEDYVNHRLTGKDFERHQKKRRKEKNEGAEGDVPTERKSIEDSVAPLRQLDYPTQLKKKQRFMVRALKKVKKETIKFEEKCGRKADVLGYWLQKEYMKRERPPVPESEETKTEGAPNGSQENNFPEYNTGEISGCCCPVFKVKSTQATTGYRNKCEFTIGLDSEKQICTGFRRGRFRDLDVSVEKPTKECMVVSGHMILVADACTQFLKQSKLKPYCHISRDGVWRQLTVRSTTKAKDNEMLIMIQLKKLGAEESELNSEIERFQTEFLGKTFDGVKITSVNICFYDGTSVQENVVPDITFGAKVIVEELGGLKYNISPGAFFQTNTRGAEVLYELVGEYALSELPADLCKEAILLDVCCGTGTIGLSLANRVKHVIGVDLSGSAILDARENATLNQCSNATFVCAAAEHVMGSIVVEKGRRIESSSKMAIYQEHMDKMSPIDKESLEKAKSILVDAGKNSNPIIAIVDPPRAGLHPSVIRALRMAPKLERLVYVSCNPTGSFIEDAKNLCTTENSKRRPGKPYTPIKANPVDMFPHTDHCELVTLFTRKLDEPKDAQSETKENKL